MKPFQTLDSFTAPDGQRLTLHHRDGDYFINLDGHELMSTRVHGSETELGTLGCSGLARNRKPRVLIGGLGLGFTLKAALGVLGAGAEVIQAEAFPVVAEWHRQHLKALAVPLEDPRVRLHLGDVSELIRSPSGGRYDAILLDTDNGPDAMCVDTNASMYDDTGLELIRSALRPKGTLAVWSAHEAPAFVKRLRRAGFDVRPQTVRGHGRKGPRHVVFLAVS